MEALFGKFHFIARCASWFLLVIVVVPTQNLLIFLFQVCSVVIVEKAVLVGIISWCLGWLCSYLCSSVWNCLLTLLFGELRDCFISLSQV